MAAFKMFDPYAFLAAATAEPHRSRPVAGLATSAPHPENATPEVDGVFHRSATPLFGDASGSEGPALAGLATLAAADGVTAVSAAARNAAPRVPPAKLATAAKPVGRGVVQDWKEGIALLDAEQPPHDVPPRRWRQFLYDAARFLDGGFADQAAALGWDVYDLFGCDCSRPYARIDNAGLIWLLNGNRLIAMTELLACIDMKTGSTQTYYRKPGGARLAIRNGER